MSEEPNICTIGDLSHVFALADSHLNIIIIIHPVTCQVTIFKQAKMLKKRLLCLLGITYNYITGIKKNLK